ncbi:hypothetical protein ABQG65_14000 [Yersinia alsatica]|uniref:hypothetical protein n=1 Tax=Yersinia alsatica TaxID=2890317 RepID=UPI0032EEBC6F
MTIAEKLKLEGFKEGFMEGFIESYQKSHRETLLQIARSLLAEGVERALVKEVTGLRDEDLTQ